MAILLSASNISKAFAARPLFDGITFAIESGERIGLIGPNGAGKSTLLRILASQASPDDGTLSLQRGLRVGFLEQSPKFTPGATVQASILEGTHDPYDWESVVKAEELMSKLSLGDPETLVQNLSGGWKKRVALARELIRNPDLLLLDEPTNHLDVESILWLENLMAESSFATLTITHDRLFLQRIANRILELDRRNPQGLLSIKGDYATYLETKEQMMAAQERREVILKNTLRRETEWLRRGAKARSTKQQARIGRAGELKEEVSELGYRNQVKTARIDFQGAEKNPKKLIDAKGISKKYDGRPIFSKLDLMITPGKRIGILGPNGCGKSTLIRVLLGIEESDTGTVTRSDNLTVAYFEQNRDALDPLVTVSKTLCPQGDFVDYRGGRVHIRSYLDRFLFSKGQMEMAVGKLSGGEQSRILIAQLMLKEANFLVLDEPTNDLDMATLAVLEDCLVDFPGAVLLVTHDRYFLDQVATQILAFGTDEKHKGKITSFEGLEQWETWHSDQERVQLTPPKSIPTAFAPETAAPAKKKKLSFKEQREFDSMEANIHKAEEALEKATAESALPANARNSAKLMEITQEMNRLQAEIDRLYKRWSELE
jgi:ATP-binding cassette subfamily F protein uup